MIDFIEEEYYNEAQIIYSDEVHYKYSDLIDIVYDISTGEFLAMNNSDEIDEDIIVIESEEFPIDDFEFDLELWDKTLSKEDWLTIKKFILNQAEEMK